MNNITISEKLKSPYADFSGATIYESDIVKHSNGVTGEVVYIHGESLQDNRWLVVYSNGASDKLSELHEKYNSSYYILRKLSKATTVLSRISNYRISDIDN